MLQVKIVDKPVKPLTLADVKPGERFKWSGTWYLYPTGPHSPKTDSCFYALSECDRRLTTFSRATDQFIEIDGRTPPAPATVPVGDLKPGDVFEWNGRRFLRTRNRQQDSDYGHANTMPLDSFCDGYTFTGEARVTPCPDAVLTITRG